MAKLTQQMKDIISIQPCFYSTADKTGAPNIALKRSTRVLDDNTLIFTEGFGGTTYKNISNGSKVAIGVINAEVNDGYRFVGTPEIQTTGEHYENIAAISAQNNRPAPIAVILIKIDEIYSLKPGAMAGKKIE